MSRRARSSIGSRPRTSPNGCRPEGEPLKPAEIAALRAWIAQGAKAPADEQPERDPRDHWAFKTPVRPAVPAVANPDWVKNPIDAFIAAEHREARPDPAATGRQAGLAAPRLSRSDRPAADARRARRVPRRRLGRRLREGRDAAARQPAVRRALGPALDGHLAVQRLVGTGRRGPQHPEAHLALARLDRRIAQRRQGLRPDAPRDARGRRAVSRPTSTGCAPPASSPGSTSSSTARPGSTRPSSTRRRRCSA